MTIELIQQALKQYDPAHLTESSLRLLHTLGYQSDRRMAGLELNGENFSAQFGSAYSLNQQRARTEEWQHVEFLFQLTGEELTTHPQLSLRFNASVFDAEVYQSYLFFALQLSRSQYSRAELSAITREVNRVFPMPVMLLITYDDQLSLAIIHRRPNKMNHDRDVLEKVTIIKDISLRNPHRAHIDILDDLSLVKLAASQTINNFLDLHEAWQKVLDVSELNKNFFRELSNWYFWAIDRCVFPPEAGDDETRNPTSIIRLITRMIFLWFIREKGLVPDDLFDQRRLQGILKDTSAAKSTYYKAILQNLFFATLNQEMDADPDHPQKRVFRPAGSSTLPSAEYGMSNYYRYQDAFVNPSQALKLFSRVPFLNGGLFDCLDREREPGEEVPQGAEAKIRRVDGFSERPQNPLAVPNELFFCAEHEVDLNAVYGTSNKRYKVRGLVDLLGRYKFTIEENTPIDQEIALDPELLGRVFENLLAQYNPETGISARKQTGSFYTPREIVSYMVDESLLAYLNDRLEEAFPAAQPPEAAAEETNQGRFEQRLRALFAYRDQAHGFSDAEVKALINAIDHCKVLDPACGSGAFPMGILHRLVDLLQKLDTGNGEWRNRQLDKIAQMMMTAGQIEDTRVREEMIADLEAQVESIHDAFNHNELNYGRKLYLIENCIYGVDIQPIAVQIAKLRFFISLVVDQKVDDSRPNRNVRALPNLETKFVAANTLIALEKPKVGAYAQNSVFHNLEIDRLEETLKRLRQQHFSARSRAQKLTIQQRDRETRTTLRGLLVSDGWTAGSAARLAGWDPYAANQSADFFDPEWMFGVADGFDVVIGNPPYIQLQTMHNIADALQKQGFKTFARTGDIYCLFYEKGVQLLCEKGILTYITSNKWMRAGYGEALRNFFAEKTNPLVLLDFSGQKIFESATVDVNILILEKAKNKKVTKSCVISSPSSINNLSVFVEQNNTKSSFLSKQSWVILSSIEQRIKRKIEEVGVPLKDWDISINRGILTGFNEAFVISGEKKDELIAADPKSAEIIRPILRGRDIKRYGYEFADLWLINTHNGIPSKRIPRIDVSEYPAIKRHLDNYYQSLDNRFDKGDTPYNLRSCDYMDDFSKQKIIYAETMRVHKNVESDRFPRFGYSSDGIYLDKTCFMITGSNLLFILPILNSKLINFIIKRNIAVMDTGGFLMQKIYIEHMPIPNANNDIKKIIESLALQIIDNRKNGLKTYQLEDEIDFLVYDLFGFSKKEISFIASEKTVT